MKGMGYEHATMRTQIAAHYRTQIRIGESNWRKIEILECCVGFEFTAVVMKSSIFWDIPPCNQL